MGAGAILLPFGSLGRGYPTRGNLETQGHAGLCGETQTQEHRALETCWSEHQNANCLPCLGTVGVEPSPVTSTPLVQRQ